MNLKEYFIDYSERRPLSQTWRISSEGHTTYGKSKEEALFLHEKKLSTIAKIESLIEKCVTATI